MKKSTKIIISIAVIITILIIGAFVVFIMLMGQLDHLTILSIENDRIICDSGYIDQKRLSREQNIITEEELQTVIQLKLGYYYFLTENVLFIDSNWHIADVSKLKVGDYIQVFSIKPTQVLGICSNPRKIENVKFVRVFRDITY